MLHAHNSGNHVRLLVGLVLMLVGATDWASAQSGPASQVLSQPVSPLGQRAQPLPPFTGVDAENAASTPCADFGRHGYCGTGGSGTDLEVAVSAAGASKVSPTPPPIKAHPVVATLQFSAPRFTVLEGGGSIPVIVTRTGPADSVVTVDYRINDNTATEKNDFTFNKGTLTFASGETTKSFNVLITEDSYVEGTELATITLSNVAGDAALGSQSTTTLMIIDDALEPATNPNNLAGPFVRQHYNDFLARDPDASGFAFWTDQINACGTDEQCVEVKRVNVSGAFYVSIEFQETAFLVYRAFKTAFGNIPGKSVPVTLQEIIPDLQQVRGSVVVKQGDWRAQLDRNQTAYFDSFVKRPRFTNAYPQSMPAEQFVATLDTNAGGVLSPLERTQLAAELQNNVKTRAQVLMTIAEDPDLVKSEFNRAFVLSQYYGYLRRDPDAAPDNNFDGYNFWLRKLDQFGGNFIQAEMVKAFISSLEYRSRFGLLDRVNQQPVAEAGAAQTILLPDAANLEGRVSDDVPAEGEALSITWSKVSGPSSVVFSNDSVRNTTATFGQKGTYVLRLTANDSHFADSDDVTITVEKGPPPTITAVVTPAPNAAGWNRSDTTVTFICSDPITGITSCTAPVGVVSDTPGQLIVGTAVNRAGEVTTTAITVKLDKTPPSLDLTAPVEGTGIFTSPVVVTGKVLDALSGLASITCNATPAVLNGDTFSCSVPLTQGANPFATAATDIAGNSSTSDRSLVFSRAPSVTITSPSNLSFLNITPTTVTGTVDDSGAAVTVNSVPAVVVNGAFSVALPLAEGPNTITASATASSGATGTASTQVTLDTTPPRVTITSPSDQFVTTSDSISVAGSVNDIVVGTVNETQAQVSVNGGAAQVANRTFLATNVPLAIGPNVIQAVGRDRVGNAATTQITVTRQPSTQAQIRLTAGNNQTGVVGSLLSSPLVAALTDAAGNPVSNKPVIFKVTQNDGMVNAGGEPGATVVAMTDGQGRAQVQWKLGMRAGAGGNSVEAYSVGFEGTAIFTASATQGVAGKIIVDTGNDQTGSINQPLPKPFIVVVVDAGNNRLAGTPVTFTVKEGGGSFGGQSTFTVNTDSDGRAAATLMIGAQEGNANNLVEVSFPSNTGFPANFTASGRAPGNPAQTTISGVVLDNSNVPIPGVTVRAVLTNMMNANGFIVQTLNGVQTDAQGQFTIPQAPVGFVKLLVDGSTAQRPGTYPTLDYDMVTVAGQNNTVGMPIFLLALNPDNKLCVTATDGGGTLTMPEAPGFALTFGPGQVTFPGGSKEGCVSVTVVHGDKVPMVPGFGQQPRFIVTIQPAGAVFNAPARITLPNVDGLKPREVTEMYSFDHDIGSFVAIGTGVVSDDGRVITSSPGVGVLKAGWHCGGNPNTTGSAGTCPDCKKCEGSGCVADASQEAKTCSGDLCKVCRGGACTPIPLNTTETETAFTFGLPVPAVDKLNDALEKFRTLGVLAEVNLLEVGGKVSSKECCDPKLGKGKETSGSVTGDFGGFDVKIKVWPPGPIPTFKGKVDALGLASLEVEAVFVGGVFFGLSGHVTGEIGHKTKDCSANAADRNGCFFANLKTTLTPSLSAEIGGQGSLTFDCFFCNKTTISVEGSLILGEFSWDLDISNVSYNEESCTSGVKGGLFQPGPGEFKISAHFSGSWEPEGSTKKTFERTFDFLKCEITLSGVECK